LLSTHAPVNEQAIHTATSLRKPLVAIHHTNPDSVQHEHAHLLSLLHDGCQRNAAQRFAIQQDSKDILSHCDGRLELQQSLEELHGTLSVNVVLLPL